MPWTCPACSLAIKHSEMEPTPRRGVIYRCHICRLELVLDALTGRLTMPPVEDLQPLPQDAAQLGAGPLGRKVPRTRSNVFTKHPDTAAPLLRCSECDVTLQYIDTVFSGVKGDERYDRFICHTHGRFEYRHRTRHLRGVADP